MIALKKTLMRFKFIDLLEEITMRVFQKLIGGLAQNQKQNLAKSQNVWEDYKKSVINGTNNTYSSFNPEFTNNTDLQLELKLNKCVFCEVLEVHDELNLAPLMCEYDSIFTFAIADYIIFERPKTIAEGFNCCVFRYLPRAG